jgi:hypothetical protein
MLRCLLPMQNYAHMPNYAASIPYIFFFPYQQDYAIRLPTDLTTTLRTFTSRPHTTKTTKSST